MPRWCTRHPVARRATGCRVHHRGIPWHDVLVVADRSGRPRIEVRGQAALRCATMGVARTHLSITHDAGVAAAVVVLEGN